MREIAFDAERLRSRLAALSERQQVAFGASCCARLLPNYSAFQRDALWGDVEPLRAALDQAWAFAEGRPVSAVLLVTLVAQCEALAPSFTVFDSLFTAPAQHACFALCNLLDYLLEPELWKLIQVASYARDSVDFVVQEREELDPEAPNVDASVEAHPWMRRELAQQRRALDELASFPEFDLRAVGRFRSSWGRANRGSAFA